MHHFFVKNENILENRVRITGDDYYHLAHVLRVNVNEKIIISTEDENNFLCEVCAITSLSVNLNIIEKLDNTELLKDIILYQSLIKGDNFELILQKSTELGVRKIVPVITKNTLIHFDKKSDEEKKILRWKKIVNEAAKQSKRTLIPEINPIIDLKTAISEMLSKETLPIIFYENAKDFNETFKEISKVENENIKSISIFLGPEGGFHPQEIEYVENLGLKTFSLGKRILRAETASIFAVGLCMSEIERINKHGKTI